MSFSKEPIVWVGAIIVTLQIFQAIMLNEPVTTTLSDSFIVAVGAVLGRHFVTPVEYPNLQGGKHARRL